MATVKRRPGEDIEALLKRFNHRCSYERIRKEHAERSRYKSPSEKRRAKQTEARKRNARLQKQAEKGYFH